MQQEFLKQLNTFHQTAYDANRQLTDINVRAFEKLVKKQFSYASSCMERMNKQFEVAAASKLPADYLRVQGELAKECAEKTLALNKETMDILVEARGEFNAWLEKGLAQATELTVVANKNAA
jgi:phasin family protein